MCRKKEEQKSKRRKMEEWERMGKKKDQVVGPEFLTSRDAFQTFKKITVFK